MPARTNLSLMATMKRLRRNRKGSAVTEFAIAAPVVIMAIVGIIEFSMILFVSSLLEGGLREASRFGLTGFQPNGLTREERILKIVEDHTHGLVDGTAVNLSTLVYPSFDSIGQPEPFTDENSNGTFDAGEPYMDVNGNNQWDPDMGAAGLGGPEDIVLYTIEYDWPLMTGMLNGFIGNNGKIGLRASVVVRNEPYGTTE